MTVLAAAVSLVGPVAETNSCSFGSVHLTTMFVPIAEPWLVTTISYVSFVPSSTGSSRSTHSSRIAGMPLTVVTAWVLALAQ